MAEKGESSRLSGFLLAYTENESEPVRWAFQEERFLAEMATIWDKLPGEGLHLLKSGDFLSIYSVYRSKLPIWQGRVNLRGIPPIIESSYGLMIASTQEAEDQSAWISWFVNRNDAELISTE